MAQPKDRKGMHRFKPDKILSAQRLTGFFGRLIAKKKQVLCTVLASEGDGGDAAAEMKSYQLTSSNMYTVVFLFFLPYGRSGIVSFCCCRPGRSLKYSS